MLDKLNQDIKQSMLDQDFVRVSVLKMVKAELQNQTIANKGKLTDDDAVQVMAREVKKRKEAAQMYKDAGDEVRANTELAEAEIISEYLPEQMGDEEVAAVIDEVMAELKTDNMGQIMGAVMAKVKGKADGSVVSRLVNEKLAQ